MGSMPEPKVESVYDVIVVGGGFSGIYQLHALRKFGFNVRLFEAGSALGGIWYWNCYPGARVDTEVPCYQFTAPETWDTWDWKERYPGRDEIESYMRHVDNVWDLSKDVSYNTRVDAVHWDDTNRQWDVKVNGNDAHSFHSRFVVLCTGFASSPYTPKFNNISAFKGESHHTSLWPQSGVDLKDKRVGVIGTGATGVQVIQTAGRTAKSLTVFQRTPNMALPMTNPLVDERRNKELKSTFPDTDAKIHKTFAGFTYEFHDANAKETPEAERLAKYEELFTTGGLHFWLGTFKDVLFDRTANDEAYKFWREKTLARIKNPKARDILAPEKAPHPFGTKRISLEQGYYETFNQDNVDIVSTAEDATPIETFTEKGIKTSDGKEYEFDVIVFATGFDAISGGITQIDVRGLENQAIKEKWSKGTLTHLGMTTSGFPNLFFLYGPQAPTAFATGPSSAECQGDWVVECLRYMRREHKVTFNPTKEAEEEWREHVNDIGEKGLFSETKSWYFGQNIPGKPKEALNYMAGLPVYRQKCGDAAKEGYRGFVMV